ncbi:MAG: universal stress protein [Haloferacaceae archaeon]
MERVLLAIGPEEDERRLERLASTTADVVQGSGATVELLHVFTEDEFDRMAAQLDYSFESDATPDEVASRLSSVKQIGDRLAAAGVEYAVSGEVGEYGPLIVEAAEGYDADLVVVGGEKQSPAGKAMFGSTAQYVLLNAHCPVVFVKKAD